MTAMELIPDDEGVLAFDNAIDLEMGLRPLRLKLADYVMALFNRALSAAKARGITLGNPKLHTARKSAVEAVKAKADRYAANVLPIIREAQKAGARTLREIAEVLNARGIATARGGQLRVPKT